MNPIYKFALRVAQTTNNLLNPDTIVHGRINPINGSIIVGTGNITTDYIAVAGSTTYKMVDNTNAPRNWSIIAFYTSTKTLISAASNRNTMTTPANARFVRITMAEPVNAALRSFTLSTNNYEPFGYLERNVKPLYGSDLSKDYDISQNEKFYRAKLGGNLLFVADDYTYIMNAPFETEFGVVLYISWDNGQTWAEYWKGKFFKTDCKFDENNKSIEVNPETLDEYTDVLAGMDKEFDLLELKPEIENMVITKRPLIQVYRPGDSVVGCFLSGMSWEQDCQEVTNETQLVNDFHFTLNSSKREIELQGELGDVPPVFLGDAPTPLYGNFQYDSNGYRIKHTISSVGPGGLYTWEIIRLADNVTLWQYQTTGATPFVPPYEVTLTPVSGSGAVGNVVLFARDIKVYARMLVDVETVSGVATAELSLNDMVDNNRNYKRVVGYGFNDIVYYSDRVTNEPTEYGIRQPGEYYEPPYSLTIPKFYPISKTTWGMYSVWFAFSALDDIVEQSGRKEYTLNDAFPLHSVISVLLRKIAPGITHEATTEYSQFLYDTYNPISNDNFKLYLSPKSNILAGEYQQPAQKGKITLRSVMNMLRDCYRAYWYVDNGKFKIEHIQWFKNGGRYVGTPVISHDLTTEIVTRNRKAWAFGTSQYDYNKPSLPERYEFGWMDEVTTAFEGFPIDVISKFVNAGNIENVNVTNFTSDIDYMLLNPGGCSKDGFALMAAVNVDGSMKLPIVTRTIDDVAYTTQNGLLAFIDLLPKYYTYDLPAYRVTINNAEVTAQGITREKKQTVRFPVTDDPNPMQLIKTNLGNGQVEKISVNLSSRSANATLMFDTYKVNE